MAKLVDTVKPSAEMLCAYIFVETRLAGRVGSFYSHLGCWLFASTQSGNYKAGIIVGNVPESRSCAAQYLPQCDGDLENISVQDRKLELLSYIDLSEIYPIAIDERRGVIYL